MAFDRAVLAKILQSVTCGVAGVSLLGCSQSDKVQLGHAPLDAGYVAMGSSFAAGAGIGPKREGSPARCGRNTNNYASLLAQERSLQLDDVSCSGATTAHILGAWNDLSAQVEAVKSTTSFVTITIGGNDVGYMGALFYGSCLAGVSGLPGPCRPMSDPTEADFSRLQGNLVQISREVHRRAPRAHILFVQYVSLLSDSSCAKEVVTADQAMQARRIAARLAAITEQAAKVGGAEVLPTDQLSLPHRPCSAQPWANGFYNNYAAANGTPWHPNAAGHAAIAKLISRHWAKYF